jgi:hypothetical protein
MFREQDLRRQMIGLIGGAVAGLAAALLFPALGENFGLFTVALWGAVLGGVLTSLGAFLRAGKALTRNDNPYLNLLVGLGLPVLILLLIYYLSTLL